MPVITNSSDDEILPNRVPKPKLSSTNNTDSDSDINITQTRKKLKRKDKVRSKRVLRSNTSDVEIWSVGSEHTSEDLEFLAKRERLKSKRKKRNDEKETLGNNEKPQGKKKKSKINKIWPESDLDIIDDLDKEILDVNSSESDGGHNFILYCSECCSQQPLDNFSKKEQDCPKYGIEGRVCLKHRINSGVGRGFSKSGGDWTDCVGIIEEKFRGLEGKDEIVEWESEVEVGSDGFWKDTGVGKFESNNEHSSKDSDNIRVKAPKKNGLEEMSGIDSDVISDDIEFLPVKKSRKPKVIVID